MILDRVAKAKQDYRKHHRLPKATLVVFKGPDGDIIIGRQVVKGRLKPRTLYLAPWSRYLPDGTIEDGILWGGDAWDGHPRKET